MDADSKHARLAVRCLLLVAAAVLALGMLPWELSLPAPAAASPFVAVCSAIAVRAVGVVTLFGLPVLVISLFRRRWFCRWGCPMGLILEQAGRIRRSAGAAWRKMPPIGRWAALATLAGACFGYPLLLWMDPLAMFGGFFGVFRWPLTAAGVASAVALPIVVIATVAVPNVWCGRLCPLGATQELLASAKRLVRREKPGSPEPSSPTARSMARRSLLAMGVGAVWAAVTVRVFGRGGRRALRPPGAVDETRFTGLCVRCGQCVRACPTGIIRPDLGRFGAASFLTPVIRYDESHCLADCLKCTEVCPSGAIRRLSPESKPSARIGLAKVDESICLVGGGQECSVCVDHCPYEAIRVLFDEEYYAASLKIDAERCNGCGICQVVCVTAPKKAITVLPR